MNKKGTADKFDLLIGAKIRMLRRSKGLSQQELSQSIGVTFQQLQKYERASNRVCATRLYRISRVLGVDVTVFFEDFSEFAPYAKEKKNGSVPVLEGQMDMFKSSRKRRNRATVSERGAAVLSK